MSETANIIPAEDYAKQVMEQLEQWVRETPSTLTMLKHHVADTIEMAWRAGYAAAQRTCNQKHEQ